MKLIELINNSTTKQLKRLLIGAYALLAIVTVNAQEGGQYLDSTCVWYVEKGAAAWGNTYFDYITYSLEGDTLIEGESFYKLYKDQIDSVFTWDWYTQSHIFLQSEETYHEYSAAIREDSLKRFFVVYPDEIEKELLFDFNLELGESVTSMIANENCFDSTIVVSEQGYLELGNIQLKSFRFSNSFSIPPKVLYEGIGASGGLIRNGSLCQFFESGACLQAYKRGADSVFIDCGSFVTSIADFSIEDRVEVYPNPATDILRAAFFRSLGIGRLRWHDIQIIDITGRIVKEMSNVEHRMLNDEVEIDVFALTSGLYTIKMSTVEGSAYSAKFVKE